MQLAKAINEQANDEVTREALQQLAPPDGREDYVKEIVKLAKRYGTEDSGAFVNGVLERIANDLGRKDADQSG